MVMFSHYELMNTALHCFRHLYKVLKCFNLFIHPGRMFAVTGDCFLRNKIFNNIHSRFLNR